MQTLRSRSYLLAALVLGLALPALAGQTKVTLKGVHLCCGGCQKGAEKAVGDTATLDTHRKAKTIVVTASDARTAQKALDKLQKAGFYGQSDHKEVKMADQAKPLKGKKVSRLAVTDVHLCCGACVRDVNKALKKVEGVRGNNAEKNKDGFVIEGSFDAGAAIAALNEAGYAARVKTD